MLGHSTKKRLQSVTVSPQRQQCIQLSNISAIQMYMSSNLKQVSVYLILNKIRLDIICKWSDVLMLCGQQKHVLVVEHGTPTFLRRSPHSPRSRAKFSYTKRRLCQRCSASLSPLHAFLTSNSPRTPGPSLDFQRILRNAETVQAVRCPM